MPYSNPRAPFLTAKDQVPNILIYYTDAISLFSMIKSLILRPI